MICVSVAQPNEHQTALTLLAKGLSGSRVAPDQASPPDNSLLDELLVARDGNRLIGAMLSVPQSDRTALVWPPVAATRDRDCSIRDQLAQTALARLDDLGVRISQCLTLPDARDQHRILERHGFVHVADLEYLSRSLKEPLPSESSEEPEWIEYEPGRNEDRLATVIDRTYQGSLDCPILCQWRSAEQALESHRLCGAHDPRLWRILSVNGCDAAVLLLTRDPDDNTIEVVYAGVVPEFRGRGLGRKLLSHALRHAADEQCRVVRLGVDRRNHVARRIYQSLGFVCDSIWTAWGRCGPE